MKIPALLGIFIFSISAFATNGRTTYQAKIVKPDGYPLEASSVNFRFSVLDPTGSCVMYIEDYGAVNMTSSGGLISFSLGSGAVSFPASATTSTFSTIFDNSVASFSCQSPGIYNPTPTDNRKIVMQFNDGTGWQTLPAMGINAVPYAMYATRANNSLTLNGKADTAFVQKASDIPTCDAGKMLYFNNATFSCVDVPATGVSVNSVSVSGSALSITGTASDPVVTMTAASISQDGYLTSLDYAEFKAKLSASSTEIINTLGYTPVSSSTVASQIASSTLSGDVSGNLGSNTVDSVGGKTASQISTSVDETLAATSSATANTIVKRDASGNILATGLSAQTASLNYVDIYKPTTSFNIRLQAPTSLATNYILNLPTTSGTIGQVLATDGSGNLSWINPSTGSVVSVSATAPLASTGGSTPTISITQATSSTDGYLSSTDWNTFNNKQQATSAAIIATLGYTPADNAASGTYAQKANNLNDLTNIPQARTNLGLGTLATGNSIDLGSASATGTLDIARLPSFIGDATIAAASNTIVLSNSGVTAGTYTKVTVDGKGRVTSGAQLSSSDVTTALGYTPATSTTLAASFVQKTGDTMTGILNLPSNGLAVGSNQLVVSSTNVGIGVLNPTAALNLKAGTTSLAPLKFTSGTLLSSAQSGTVEYDGSQLYFTDGSNTRRAIATNSSPGSFDNVSSISNTSGNITLSPDNITGSVIVNSSAASISSGTGALVVNGGVGIGGSINAGGNLNLTGSATIGQSLSLSSMTSGSLLFAGASGLVSEDNSRLFWDGANKRLGLGTNSPAQTLSVSGSSYFSGNVGIGTTNPVGLLEIGTNTVSSSAYRFVNAGYQSSMRFVPDNTANWIQSGLDYTSDSKKDLKFSSINGVTTWMTLQASTGNVGIGTTTPDKQLTMHSTGLDNYIHLTSSMTGTTNLDGVMIGTGTNGDAAFYNRENTNMLFLTNNIERLRIDATGKVGIGTTTPSTNLDIVESQNGDTTVNVRNINTGTSARSGFTLTNSGTTYGSDSAGLFLSGTGHSGGEKVSLFSNSSIASGVEIVANASTAAVMLSTQGLERMRVTNTGNVGIGTASPLTTLDVNGSLTAGGVVTEQFNLTVDGVSNTTYAIGSLTNNGKVTHVTFHMTVHNSSTIDALNFQVSLASYSNGTFYPNWLELPVGFGSTGWEGRKNYVIDVRRQGSGSGSTFNFRVRNKGGVGSSSTMTIRMTYNSDATFTRITHQNSVATTFNAGTAAAGGAVDGMYGGLEYSFPVAIAQSWRPSDNDGLFVKNSGNVGIGTTAPTAKLDVSGTINIASGSALTFGGTNVCTAAGCTSTSDARLKENIKPLDFSLEKLLSLNAVEYDWKNKAKYGDQHQIGFLAQDLEKVYPEVVYTDKNTGLKSVTYGQLIAPLLEGLKALYKRLLGHEEYVDRQIAAIVESKADKAEIEELRKDNVELKQKAAKVDKLESENTALKAYLCSKDPAASICK